jgi:hypothetical protein
MLRRALVLTGIAVVVSAACAFAVSPRVSGIGRSLSRELFGFDRGFTPATNTAHDSAMYEIEGGAPGTYCPIPPRNDGKSVAEGASSGSAVTIGDIAPASSASQAMSSPVKGDSLLLAPPAKCTVPAPAGTAQKPILP